MDSALPQTITAIHWWNPHLFSLRIQRPTQYTFKAGQFARLGIQSQPLTPTADLETSSEPKEKGQRNNEQRVWRPFSIVSNPAQPFLEFFGIVVPHGAFTQRVKQLLMGDSLWLDPSAYGFLTLDRLASTEDLWLFSTGTGLGPFLSILSEATPWQRFQRIILIHCVRFYNDLAYAAQLKDWENNALQPGGAKLYYVPVVTRESRPNIPRGRLPDLMENEELYRHLGFSLAFPRASTMLCGNPQMIAHMRRWLQAQGFAAGRRGTPGTLAVEPYW